MTADGDHTGRAHTHGGDLISVEESARLALERKRESVRRYGPDSYIKPKPAKAAKGEDLIGPPNPFAFRKFRPPMTR